MDPVRISREVPLDQLRHPDFDVRQGRPEADIRSIAQSMGDPGQGQQQPINVFPADRDDLPDDPGADDLHGYFQADGRLIIHDGVTRALAAQKLGWETIWAVITPAAPENEVIARLSANTDRVDMTDYETVSTLYEYYAREDITQADLAEKAGMGASTLSKLFSVLDGPDWLSEPWADPGVPFSSTHAIYTYYMFHGSALEDYQEAGDLGETEAKERAIEDAKMMIRVQTDQDLQPAEFQTRCQRLRKQTCDELADGRDWGEKQADGATQAAEAEAERGLPDPFDGQDCMVCGQDPDRKVAVPVCGSHYGLMTDMRNRGESLTQVTRAQADLPADPDPPDRDPETKAVEGLQELFGFQEQEARAVLDRIDQAAGQPDGRPDPNT